MALSEYERRILDEMWADLPPLRVSLGWRMQWGARRGLTRLRSTLLYLLILAVGVGMVVLAGVLFRNGYAAGTAAVSAGITGVLLGALYRSRVGTGAPRVGYLRADREASREQ